MEKRLYKPMQAPSRYWIVRLSLERPSVLVLFAVVLLLLPVGLILWGSNLAHERTLDYFSDQMSEKAKLAASLVNPEELYQLQTPEDTDNEIYRKLISPLVVFFQSRQDVRCVHSFRVGDKNQLEYVLDVTTQLDRLGLPRTLPPSSIGDQFEGETRISQSILTQAMAGDVMAFSEPVIDEFGAFMGACAPVPGMPESARQAVCVDFVLDGINLQLEEITQLRNLAIALSLFLSGSLGLILWTDRKVLIDVNLQLQKLASIDSLTGVYNRRFFTQAMEQEFERVKRYDLQTSLLILDVDNFKPINDQFGHVCGDDVLEQLGRVLIEMLRPADIVGRLGGEEFGIIVPESDSKQAALLAERIRHAVASMSLKAPDGRVFAVTVSIGIDELNMETSNINAAYSKADARMYQAKKQGRNRVVYK